MRSVEQSRVRADLLRIYAAGVSAADPARLVALALGGSMPGAVPICVAVKAAPAVYLIAAGKAARGMAAGAAEELGDKLREGLVIVPAGGGPTAESSEFPQASPGASRLSPRLRLIAAAHPLPDASSEAAARDALEFASRPGGGDLLLCALSGGGSALMAAPAAGVSLADKINVTSALMRAGATIAELNTVRKHLSAIKGGGLLRAVNPGARVVSLLLSDVAGNDVGTIGSGPTAADPTTYGDAVAVMKRRGLWGRAPESVRDHLERGGAGEFEETVKPGAAMALRAENFVIGDNATAVSAAAQAASSMGYKVEHWRELAGDAETLARTLAAHLAEIRERRVCVVGGGEPVVTVRGKGRGGRAQQAALAMAIELAQIAPNRNIIGLFAGTDGIDGPTDAAGAIVTPASAARGREAAMDAGGALRRNDAYPFFRALGDLVLTGPTGTNVADVFVGLVNY